MADGSIHLSVLLPLLAFTSCLLLAAAVVSRVLRESALPVRVAAVICLLYGVFAAGFQLLALARVFSLAAVVPTFVLLPMALVWWRRSDVASELSLLRAEVRLEIVRLASALKQRPAVLAGVAVIAAHVTFRVARALVMPRLGWDDFTYHVFRAGLWVQNGSVALAPAPDAWSYYEFFPWGGDLVWAWALIWRAGDAVVAAASVVSWMICLPLAYGLARRYEQPPLPSFLAALALVILPSQITQIATAYVDNLQLMLVLACSALFLEALDVGRTSSTTSPRAQTTVAALLGVGCGSGVLVKLSFVPLAGMIALAVAWKSVRQRRLRNLLAFAAGTTIAVPNLAFNWFQRGSPFYPFRVLDSLPFNQQLAQLLSEPQASLNSAERGLGALLALVRNVRPEDPFLNVGFAGMILLLLGLAGIGSIWFKPHARMYLICVGISAIVAVGQLLSPSNAALVTLWGRGLGRLVVPTLAPILLLAASSAVPIQVMLLPVLLTEYFVYAPWQWPWQVLLGTIVALAALLTACLAAAVVARSRLRMKWPAIAIAVVVSLVVIEVVHDRVRYPAYGAFAAARLDDFHRAPPVGAWPIWLRLDQAGPARVAVAAGWDGIGHNWFRYGLLGSRLQHDVRYIPITADGPIVNYADRDSVNARADRQAWLTRLRDQQIEWVALLGPRTLEHQWVDELPDIFSIELALNDRAVILARVKAVRSGTPSRRNDGLIGVLPSARANTPRH